MNFPPLLRQIFVASAPQLAAISVGGFTGFPGILFSQLKGNDTSIHLDIDSTSWIGSTHGLAGTFACFMPLFMQYKGRKQTFLLSCLFGFIGWIIVYLAQSATALIAAEVIHGLCSNSMLTCSLLTISEMVHPRYRIISMNMYFLGQSFGMNLILLFGRYFSWRTVALIECCPILVALLICLAWPESPSWLAYKGEFEKCEAAFKWLRGTDADSEKELRELIGAHKETMAQRKATTPFYLNKHFCDILLQKIKNRDFYLPRFHTFVMLWGLSWSGMAVVVTYAMVMLQEVTSSESAASVGVFVIYAIVFFGNAVGLVLLKYLKNKTIIMAGGAGITFFMIAASVSSYLQNIKILPPDSLVCICCLVAYTIACNLGTSICIMSVAAELMPIKHRGIGGAFYGITASFLEFLSLKLSPYLLMFIKPSGTFLFYAINVAICTLFVWRYVPETKNETLQKIEDFYNNDKYCKRSLNHKDLESIKDSKSND